MKNKNHFFLFSILLVYVFMNFGSQTVAQTQRNPVLEECTGTWCQWCPCGHDIMEEIKAAMPNAIMIGYHGPANGSDPYSFFPGNQILGLMGFSGYPTAVIDRTGPPISRGSWAGVMNQRFNVPATVSITMDKSFNSVTGELDATVHVSALENLTGEYKMTMILLEDGLLHSQTGNGSCPGGGSDYVHNHVVRAVINGANGEELNGGNPWNIGEIISKPVQYTVPAEIEPDSSHLVVLVHKVQGVLNSGEIQQAEEWTLVSPDYVATISSTSEDIIAENSALAEFSTVVRSEGILDDMYYIDITMDSPIGWSGEYETANGTFPFSHQDQISVPAGDTAVVLVRINPNGIDGSGNTEVQFTSMNDPGVIAIAYLRNVTTTGVEVLVVDASEEDYGSLVSNSLDNVYAGTHGLVSRNAINALVDLSNFHTITWSAGNDPAAFYPEELTALETYLNGCGKLFINGQNIGSDIFEPGGQSQFAQSFYNNYLHADYIANSILNILLGYDGDPITDGMLIVIGDIYEKSPDEILPIDADGTPILKFNIQGVNSIRVSTNTSRIVYLGIGFEQIGDEDIRDTLMQRIINYFDVEPPQLPSVPNLISPADSDVIDSLSALFVWEQSQPQVGTYWFELDTTDQFTTAYVNTRVQDTTFLFSNLLNNKTYWWRVGAYNCAGWSEFSEVRMFTTDSPVSVDDDEQLTPSEFSLDQNYPNPFNPSTRITYSVLQESPVTIKVYDLIGQEIAVLVDDVKEPGFYSVTFDALNLSSGVYIYQMRAGDFTSVKKMSILK
jgi:hypothetical protein